MRTGQHVQRHGGLRAEQAWPTGCQLMGLGGCTGAKERERGQEIPLRVREREGLTAGMFSGPDQASQALSWDRPLSVIRSEETGGSWSRGSGPVRWSSTVSQAAWAQMLTLGRLNFSVLQFFPYNVR